MEKMLTLLLDNIGFIFIGIAIICFIIPMIYTSTKRKKRKISRDVLDRKTIMADSGVSSRLLLILFLLIFVIFGIIIIYLAISKSENNFNMVFGIIMGIIVCAIPTCIIINSIKTALKVYSGNYVIILDELKDKYYYQDRSYDGDGVDMSGWQLYFKDYFKTYNKYIKYKDLKEGTSYKEGDKFYLVFVKGNSDPYMFAANEYTLSPNEKLQTIEEVKDYMNLKEYVLETNNEQIIINKERITKDFFDKSQKQTVLIDLAITIGIVLFGILTSFLYFNIFVIILLFLVFALFLVMTIVKIKYLLTINNNIKNNNYVIKEDEITSLNNRLNYSDSNKMISFKLKNYKKIVYADKKYFTNIEVGDKLYLVFVKNEKEPIKVYNKKNCTLENNVKVL